MEGVYRMNKLEWLLQDLHEADNGGNGGSDPKPEGSEGDDPEDTGKPEGGEDKPDKDKPDKKYTDDEVNDIIDSKFAKWKKELENEKKKATERAKLSEEERIKEEKEDLEKQIEDYKRKELVSENAKVASKKLDEADLPHDDAVIEMLTTDDEDVTTQALNVLIDYVAKVKKNNTVQTPPNEGGKFKGDNASNKSLKERAKENRIIEN